PPAGARRQGSLDALRGVPRGAFVGLREAVDGLPLTTRLLDPPLHEFLPDITELSVKVAKRESAGKKRSKRDVRLLAAVRRLHEQNPMLGLRGVRLGLTIPGLYGMQTRAILEAGAQARGGGAEPHSDSMVP